MNHSPLFFTFNTKMKMKISLTIICVFAVFLLYAFSGLYEHARIGGTQLNGNGCVCHNLNESQEVDVWMEGPDTLYIGQTGIYRMYLAGGPAEAGGYNVAGRFGVMTALDSFSVWDYREPGELTQAFPLPFPTPEDTIFWEFAYTASDSSTTDTLYSCGLSLVWDAIPDSNDLWAFGPKFPLTITEDLTPVELISFTIDSDEKGNRLSWSTATEMNNKGFEIQRAKNETDFSKRNYSVLGFIDGMGTTTIQNKYQFIDAAVRNNFSYRLKQIDFDGRYYYSPIVSASEIASLKDFTLNQNYPNPFNPSTVISWQSPFGSWQTLIVYDLLGNKIATLIDEYKPAGKHEVDFNLSQFSPTELTSGIYFYSLESSGSRLVKKMLVLK